VSPALARFAAEAFSFSVAAAMPLWAMAAIGVTRLSYRTTLKALKTSVVSRD
jgi:hypothetical protein